MVAHLPFFWCGASPRIGGLSCQLLFAGVSREIRGSTFGTENFCLRTFDLKVFFVWHVEVAFLESKLV